MDAAQQARSVRDYFGRMDGEDKAPVVELFTPGAVVEDDHETYRGRDAILSWLAGPASAYTTSSVLLSVEHAAGVTTVVVLLTGDFPGGSVELVHRFTLADDGLIDTLSIRALPGPPSSST